MWALLVLLLIRRVSLGVWWRVKAVPRPTQPVARCAAAVAGKCVEMLLREWRWLVRVIALVRLVGQLAGLQLLVSHAAC